MDRIHVLLTSLVRKNTGTSIYFEGESCKILAVISGCFDSGVKVVCTDGMSEYLQQGGGTVRARAAGGGPSDVSRRAHAQLHGGVHAVSAAVQGKDVELLLAVPGLSEQVRNQRSVL